MKNETSITAETYFAVVPEWIIYADISASALRLYCVLRRHADKNNGRCHPSRQRLADLCKVSVRTIDRAVSELTAIGAILVTHRISAVGDYTSNLYVVQSSQPTGVATSVSLPSDISVVTGGDTSGDQTIVSINQSQGDADPNKLGGGELVAKQWWEAQNPKPAGRKAWFALTASCNAVKERGWDDNQILAALNRINSVPSVAQLDRELRNPRAESFETRRLREEKAALEASNRKAEELWVLQQAKFDRLAVEASEAVPPPVEVVAQIKQFGRGRRPSGGVSDDSGFGDGDQAS